MRTAFGVFVLVHAVAHAVGALSILGVLPEDEEDESANAPFLVAGWLGHGWARAVAASVWILALAGLVAGAYGILAGASWTLPVLLPAVTLSAVVTAVWARPAPFGVVANLFVIAALAIPGLAHHILPPGG